ncbi:hypothetical protein [Thermus thalpophilus]
MGYLVAERLGTLAAWGSLAYLLLFALGLTLLGAWTFARRDR